MSLLRPNINAERGAIAYGVLRCITGPAPSGARKPTAFDDRCSP